MGAMSLSKLRSVGCVTALGLAALAHSVPASAVVVTFTDTFNRPDGAVGAGWSNMTDNVNGDLVLRNGAVSTPNASGIAGIYRSADLSGYTKATATFTQINGFGGLPNRFSSSFSFGSSGSISDGLQIQFTRGDINYTDSAVTLVWNGQIMGLVRSTFQYNTAIAPTVFVSPDGKVQGNVAEGSNSFSFDFGNISNTFANSNFGVVLGFPDGRAGSIINGTADNLTLTTGLSKTAPGPIELFCNGSSICDQSTFDPSKPTVVITHGWRPNESSILWQSEMAGAISSVTANLVGSNVIRVEWSDSITSAFGFLEANAKTENAGSLLAGALSSLGSFQNGIQFIGHSLGNYVNAYAARELTDAGITVDQFTILDRPLGNLNPGYDTAIFTQYLTKDKVVFVDNYFGTGVTGTGIPFQFPVVAKNIEYAGAGHSEVHGRYKATIITEVGPCGAAGGFACSIAVASQYRAPGERWNPGANVIQSVGNATNFSSGEWYAANCAVTSGNSATCSEGSDAYLWNATYSFDPAAEFLSFDINWVALGDGDWVTLMFGDDLLYSFAGTTAREGIVRSSGLILVSDYAGKSGELMFALNSVGQRNATFSISNLRQLATASSVPESKVWLMLIVGFSVVGMRLRSKERRGMAPADQA